MRNMTLADTIIDAYGGTTAVHRLTKAPISTVHSWRTNGIPEARLDHLRLAGAAAGKSVDLDSILSSARRTTQPGMAA